MGVKQRAVGVRGLEVTADSKVRCWCGGMDLEPLNPEYGSCSDCGTVIYREVVDPAEHVAGSDTSFYGDRYWQHYVPKVLGLPGLEERARADLAERAVVHLVKVLQHQAPGGRVLELGCGSGSLTYLLRKAGFDAEGLEIGPAAIEIARQRFGLTVHGGPLEALGDPGPWSAIVAIDVLEHLPDPLATLSLCSDRLGPGGRLFLQTPCYRGEGADWPMLLPEEHLYLFTSGSIERLLRAAGFTEVEVERGLFPHDMWVTASIDSPLVERADPLASVPPLVVALVDAYSESNRARGERDAIAADRDRKQQDIDRLQEELDAVRGDQSAKAKLLRRQDRELETVRRDQAEKEQLIDRLSSEVETIRTDQAAKEELIDRLGTELEAVRGDQQVKGELIGRLEAELEAVRRDQSAKEQLIERLSSELEAAQADQTAKQELIDRLGSELDMAREDQAAKEELIDRLSVELEEVRADQQAKEAVILRLDQDLEATAAELQGIREDRRYRLLEKLGVRLGERR